MDNNQLYKIALTKIPGIGAVLAKNLISFCGGAEAVFRAKKSQLIKIPGIGDVNARAILDANALHQAERELKFIEQNDIAVIDHNDERYPSRLSHFNSSPYLLYMKGKGNLNSAKTVAIVGTRKPTPKGEANCKDIVNGLKPYGVTIISGLAYGIDIIAHKASLLHDIPTFGVMGNGFGKIYPSSHVRTAQNMMESGGLITEYGFETGPDRENFPARNRIIASMADVVVVVESAAKGGSMITAIFGNEYNKDVFAVPGKPQDDQSAGCNYLIKTQQAHLCENATDIAETMRWDADTDTVSQQKTIFQQLEPKEQQLIDLIKSKEYPGIDLLAYESHIPQSQLTSILLNLEFKGCIRALPGKRYTII